MDESDQLKEDCRLLIERSRALHDRIQRLYARDVEQATWLDQLDQRCRDAQTESQRVMRLVATRRDGD